MVYLITAIVLILYLALVTWLGFSFAPGTGQWIFWIVFWLLGFSGRYSNHGAGDLQHITDKIGKRIYRLRGERLQWPLPTDIPQETGDIQPRDPWVRRLQITAASVVVLAVGLFIAYMLSLGSLSNEMRQLAASMGA